MSVKKIALIIFAFLLINNVSANTCESAQGYMRLNQYSIAITLLKSLSSTGDACAQFELGKLYLTGTQLKKDKSQGMTLIKESANQNYAPAINFLNTMAD